MTPTATNPTSAQAAPAWLREVVDACTQYEERLGWPIRVDVTSRCLTLPVGQAVDALIMPAPLAQRVHAALDVMLLAGPAIASPDGAYWTLLTDRSPTDQPCVPLDVAAAGVCAVARSDLVRLPTHLTATDRAGWRWTGMPLGRRPLPPWWVVVGATRRVLAQRVGGSA